MLVLNEILHKIRPFVIMKSKKSSHPYYESDYYRRNGSELEVRHHRHFRVVTYLHNLYSQIKVCSGSRNSTSSDDSN